MTVETKMATCCWQKLNGDLGSASTYDECNTFDNTAKVKPYSSSKRLAKFHLKAHYYLGSDSGTILSVDQYMRCDCPTCDDL